MGDARKQRKPTKIRKWSFKCDYCHREFQIPKEGGGVGYGHPSYWSKKRVCYDCMARIELKDIAKAKPGDRKIFYYDNGFKSVGNWAGKIKFPVAWATFGKHNIGGHRVDVWFRDHTGAWWHGVHIGDNSFVRATKLKETPKKPWHAKNMRI